MCIFLMFRSPKCSNAYLEPVQLEGLPASAIARLPGNKIVMWTLVARPGPSVRLAESRNQIQASITRSVGDLND